MHRWPNSAFYILILYHLNKAPQEFQAVGYDDDAADNVDDPQYFAVETFSEKGHDEGHSGKP